MTAASRPEAIDSRLVLHIYACVTIPAGIVGYMWPALVGMTDTPAWLANARVGAAAVAAVGCCAAGLAAIDDPVGRRRGLIGFAHAHILFGAMLMAQSIAVRSATIPAPLAGLALTVGLVLMYLAITGPGADFRSPLPALVPLRPEDDAEYPADGAQQTKHLLSALTGTSMTSGKRPGRRSARGWRATCTMRSSSSCSSSRRQRLRRRHDSTRMRMVRRRRSIRSVPRRVRR